MLICWNNTIEPSHLIGKMFIVSLLIKVLSDVVAEAFSADLSAKLGMNHRSDSGGSFTDTANYDHIIPECTNMSVGYFNAHSARETQLLDYLWKLKDAFVRIDCEGLVTERDAKAPVEWSMSGYYGYGDTLIKPHKEARTAMGWSKQDDIKWRQDKKAKRRKRKRRLRKRRKGITTEDLVAIIPEDDFGPKSKKSTKYDEDSPDWDDFFMQQTD